MGIEPPAPAPPASADGRDDVAIDQAVSIAARVTMMLAAMINFFMLDIMLSRWFYPAPTRVTIFAKLGCAAWPVCDVRHKIALHRRVSPGEIDRRDRARALAGFLSLIYWRLWRG
jgi:hypothetical protein